MVTRSRSAGDSSHLLYITVITFPRVCFSLASIMKYNRYRSSGLGGDARARILVSGDVGQVAENGEAGTRGGGGGTLPEIAQ